jgi:hypothetical protein
VLGRSKETELKILTIPNRVIRLSVTAVLLLIAAHRLPAPIQEIPESPTPAPEQSAKPKVKRANKSKPKSEASESTSSVKVHPSSKQSRFAGTWTGTMQTFPAGNQTTILTIDPSETNMTVVWFGKRAVAKAALDGDTLRATFPPPPFQPQSHTWSLTPQPDGVTARIHFQCFMNDFTAVFRRATAEPTDTKRAR